MQAKIRRIRNAVRRRIRHRRDFADDGMPARVDFEPDGARVHIGAQNFFIRAHGIEAPRHTVADFALFGLAIISMSANVEVRVKDPVSRSGAEAMSRLKRAISLWAMPKTYELRMEFETVVDDPRPSNATDRIL